MAIGEPRAKHDRDGAAVESPTIADGDLPAMVGSSSMLGPAQEGNEPRHGVRSSSEPSDASFSESRLR